MLQEVVKLAIAANKPQNVTESPAEQAVKSPITLPKVSFRSDLSENKEIKIPYTEIEIASNNSDTTQEKILPSPPNSALAPGKETPVTWIDTQVYESEPKFPLSCYIIMNVLVIIWSAAGITATTFIFYKWTHLTQYLGLHVTEFTFTDYLLFTCYVFCIAVSFLAMVVLFRGSLLCFRLQPYAYGLSMAIHALAIVVAIGDSTSFQKYEYKRVFEANNLFRFKNDSALLNLFGAQYIGFWDKIQETLQCCGLDGPENWLNSMCSCIPTSCCKILHSDECKASIHAKSSDPETLELQLKNPYIWSKNCRQALSELVDVIELNRLVLVSSSILIFFVIIIPINYLIVNAHHRYNMHDLLKRLKMCRQRFSGRFRKTRPT